MAHDRVYRRVGMQGCFKNQQGSRQTFFPVVDTLSDLLENPQDAGKVAPTGHPVAFGNTLGYFGGAASQTPRRNSSTQQPGNRNSPYKR